MKNTVCLLPALLFVAGFFFCSDSPFDPSSDLGGPILSTIDSSITDFNKNFKSVRHSVHVQGTYSTLDSAQFPRSGHFRLQDSLRAGPWSGESARAYLKFAGDSLMSLLSDSSIVPAHVRLQLRYDSSFAIGTDSSLTVRLARAKSDSIVLTDAMIDSTITGHAAVDSATKCSFTFDSVQVYRIRDFLSRADNYTVSMKIDSVDTGGPVLFDTTYDTAYHDFGLALTCDTLIEFYSSSFPGKQPLLYFIYAVPDSSDTTGTVRITDTLVLVCNGSDYTVADTNAVLADALFMSSAATGRRAVMKLDLSPFWQDLIDSASALRFHNVLAADIDFALDSAEARASDVIDVYYDLFARADTAVDTSSMSKRRLSRSTDSLVPGFSIDSLNLQHINRLVDSQAPVGYLFLMIRKTNGSAKVLWHDTDSIFVRAVFSNPW